MVLIQSIILQEVCVISRKFLAVYIWLLVVVSIALIYAQQTGNGPVQPCQRPDCEDLGGKACGGTSDCSWVTISSDTESFVACGARGRHCAGGPGPGECNQLRRWELLIKRYQCNRGGLRNIPCGEPPLTDRKCARVLSWVTLDIDCAGNPCPTRVQPTTGL